MKFKYVCLEGNVNKESETFKEALTEMFAYVKSLVQSKALTFQILETCIWIENIQTGETLDFYTARDLGISMGICDEKGNII